MLDSPQCCKIKGFALFLPLYHHSVDNVNKLSAKQVFPDFYYISGTHSY